MPAKPNDQKDGADRDRGLDPDLPRPPDPSDAAHVGQRDLENGVELWESLADGPFKGLVTAKPDRSNEDPKENDNA